MAPDYSQTFVLGCIEIGSIEYATDNCYRNHVPIPEIRNPASCFPKCFVVNTLERIDSAVGDFAFNWHQATVVETDKDVCACATKLRFAAELSRIWCKINNRYVTRPDFCESDAQKEGFDSVFLLLSGV